MIPIKPNERTSLYVSKAALGEGQRMDFSRARTEPALRIDMRWALDVAQAGAYRVVVAASAPQGARVEVRVGEHRLAFPVPATRGYLSGAANNMEAIEAEGTIALDAGAAELEIAMEGPAACSLSSLELRPASMDDAYRAEQQEALRRRASVARYAGQGYGLMFHWTSQSLPQSGAHLPYPDAVDAFDAEAFAAQASEAGARYVILTANHAVSHFPAPLPAWEAMYPGQTARRDLIEDLYRALHARGIDLMLYLNFTTAYLHSPHAALTRLPGGGVDYLQLDASRQAHYMRTTVELLEAIGARYGEKVKGYWLDSCYQLDQQFCGFDFRPLYEAAKVGNPERLVCFNYWVLPVRTPWQDYWAGETVEMTELPPCAVPDYGPAKGHRFHELMMLEHGWGYFDASEPIGPPRYAPEALADHARRMREIGGMLTINVQVYQDGRMAPDSLRTLSQLKNAIH